MRRTTDNSAVRTSRNRGEPFELRKPGANPRLWWLDPKITFLNHGSFGACPKAVLEYQNEMRLRLEREPVAFMVRELEPMLDKARTALSRFVGARAQDLVLVRNAASGVDAGLGSL